MNSAGGNTYTITFDSNTYQYTISATGNFGFQFGSNTSSSAYRLLGYNEEDYTEATSSTSVNIIDLNSIKGVYLDFHDDKRKDIEFSNTNQSKQYFFIIIK